PVIGGVSDTILDQERDGRAALQFLDRQIRAEQDRPLDERDDGKIKALSGQRARQEAKMAELIARMERDYPQYTALKYPQPCTLDQARACLADNDVGVLFALDEGESCAVLVEKTPRADDPGRGVAVFPLRSGA